MESINIRKRIAIYFLSALALLLLYRVTLDIVLDRLLNPFQIFLFIFNIFVFLVCVLLISSDFRILKLGFLNRLYLFIEAPEIIQQKKRSFDDLLKFFESNYFSKKYHKDTANLKLKIVKVEDATVHVDSRAAFEKLRKGLNFNIILKRDVKINDSSLDYDSVPVGLAEVEHVATLSRFSVVKWEEIKEYTEEIRNLKKGNLSAIRAYMEVVLEEEFQESSVEDLERAYNSLRKIYITHWRRD